MNSKNMGTNVRSTPDTFRCLETEHMYASSLKQSWTELIELAIKGRRSVSKKEMDVAHEYLATRRICKGQVFITQLCGSALYLMRICLMEQSSV